MDNTGRGTIPSSTTSTTLYSFDLIQSALGHPHEQSPSPPPPQGSNRLPVEIILLILLSLDDPQTFLAATSTCRHWFALAHRYRQYLWRHFCARDFAFTEARGLWKLEFLTDRDLRLCFPKSAAIGIRRKRSAVFSTAVNQDTKETPTDRAGNLCDKENASSKTVQGTRVDNHDWKALYQMTSNWYHGRAKGYSPLMLPSLTTLVSAAQTLASDASLSSSSSRSGPASGSLDPHHQHRHGNNHTVMLPTLPVCRKIHQILKTRTPLTVVGLQHEGSALTALSLISYPWRDKTLSSNSKSMDDDDSAKRERAAERDSQKLSIALIRSNPHYRSQPRSLSSQGSLFNTTSQQPPQPNIIVQDPLEHDQIDFAIRPSNAISDESHSQEFSDLEESTHGSPTNNNEDQTGSAPPSSQPLPSDGVSPVQVSPPLGNQMSQDPANDILCHFSSALHSFLVTGHMDGSVRLWDLSLQDPHRQCIRLWRTGARRRVLCVGMNSKVVVSGNADSTLCVWDIHPSPSSSSSTHGTIHTASYLAVSSVTGAMNHQVGLGVGMAPVGAGVEDWVSGIEHICVGDSLVACSTEFSGSVLVFSLATGSLVYEIPGLYQPSKMCMTDFFLLTGGRGPWTQGERPMREQSHHYVYQNQTGQGHGYGHEFGHGHGQDDDHLRHAPPHLQGRHRGAEVDEYMSCCINVWDLRTGNRLYSLIPRLPTPVNALSLQRQRSPGSKIVGSPESLISRQSSPFLAPGTLGKKLEGLDLTENTQTDHDSNWIETPHSPEAPASAPLAAINSPLWQHSSSSFSYPLADSYGRSSQALSSASSVFSPIVPQSSAAVPLTLLDIAVTPDHSTLVATLCERSGEGREGVYCWDFSGSRLEGYHETNSALTGHGRGTVPTGEGWLSSANSAFASIVLDENGLKALGENDISDSDFGDDEVASNQPPNHSDPSDLDQNNNIIMQQVDSTALRDLHRARVTGKIWIGWQLDSREFAAQRDTRFMSILDRSAAHATAGDSKVSSTTTSLQDLSKAPDMRVGTGQEVSSSARLKGKAKAMQS